MPDPLSQYPLLDALIGRRSRRFGKGMRLNGGPLAYDSRQVPQPLTLEEEAALAFAACGITGYALAELPYESGNAFEAGSGNIMAQFIGRTVASPDALHTYAVFVINDDGAWMLKRPQDLARNDYAGLVRLAQEHRFTEWYEKTRVRIADHRLDIPREVPFTHPFNKYSANVAGTTYFLPVAELTASYINGLLFAFSEEFGGFWIDDRNWFLPAGIGKFARSRGGHLHDNLKDGRSAPLSFVETWLYEVATIEQGGILQNLGLMTQALGLGGFPHFGGHPYIWFQTLGFRMKDVPASQVAGGAVARALANVLGLNIAIPTAVGLERNGQVLMQPYSPPYYRNMEEAVLAFVDFKYAQGTGTLHDGGFATAWNDGAAIQSGIPRYSDEAIEATIAFCEYVYKRYGRFPATSGPFRSLLAYQAHHLDEDFYTRFYRPATLSETQIEHSARWHSHT
jgi:hypothetical protein